MLGPSPSVSHVQIIYSLVEKPVFISFPKVKFSFPFFLLPVLKCHKEFCQILTSSFSEQCEFFLDSFKFSSFMFRQTSRIDYSSSGLALLMSSFLKASLRCKISRNTIFFAMLITDKQ